MDALEQATALRPLYAEAWLELGRASAKFGKIDQALACYRRSLEVDPNESAAYEAIGWLFLQRGERAEALRYWQHGNRVATQPQRLAHLLTELAPLAPRPSNPRTEE